MKIILLIVWKCRIQHILWLAIDTRYGKTKTKIRHGNGPQTDQHCRIKESGGHEEAFDTHLAGPRYTTEVNLEKHTRRDSTRLSEVNKLDSHAFREVKENAGEQKCSRVSIGSRVSRKTTFTTSKICGRGSGWRWPASDDSPGLEAAGGRGRGVRGGRSPQGCAPPMGDRGEGSLRTRTTSRTPPLDHSTPLAARHDSAARRLARTAYNDRDARCEFRCKLQPERPSLL